jgi:uncharacterized cysteine cluster protein YcgN (CxxCxxCC family)
MTDPIDRRGLKDRFWERKPLQKMSRQEWEALCDGCGRCCLNKLEDAESGEVALTRIACRLLDDATCRCAHYENRHQFVPDCIVLRPDNLDRHAYWLPETCAYRLLWQGNPLPDWHPLISGTAQSVHDAGISVQGMTLSEFEIPEEEWEEHIIEEPS